MRSSGSARRARRTRINELGFDVKEKDLVPPSGGHRLVLSVRLGGRNHHTNRLESLTGLEVSEWQARQILSDLHYYQARQADKAISKSVTAVQWRVQQLDPSWPACAASRASAIPSRRTATCLHYRYVKSTDAGYDVGTEIALDRWLADVRPGYLLRP